MTSNVRFVSLAPGYLEQPSLYVFVMESHYSQSAHGRGPSYEIRDEKIGLSGLSESEQSAPCQSGLDVPLLTIRLGYRISSYG